MSDLFKFRQIVFLPVVWSIATLLPHILFAGEVSADRLAEVEALFAKFDKPDVPGGAVGIVHQGRLIYSKGFGSAHLDYEAANTPTTSFEIASASKAFTSACIALLMDQGKVHPDDDIRRFIPEMHAFDSPVRIRHMLRCESGLWAQFHIMPLAGWDNVPINIAYSKADLLTVLTGQKRLPFQPGSEFQYGSSDFFLLGIVVERVTGKTLSQFAKENLFEPAGMTRTFYIEDSGLVVKDRAVGHWKSSDGWSTRGAKAAAEWRLWQANAYIAGGGGVRTCIEDLHRWDLALEGDVLTRGKYMNEFMENGTVLGNRFVVDADAYRKRAQPQPDNPPAGEYRGLKRIQFTGGFWGMSSCMARFPTENLTIICLSNSSAFSAFAKNREIADIVLADRLNPLEEESDNDEESRFIELDAKQLKARTGTFRHQSNRPVWQIEFRDGALHLVDHLESAYQLKPLTATRFKAVGDSPFYPSARFDFEQEDSGRTTAMILSSHENDFKESLRFKRVKLVQPSPDQLAEFAGVYVSDELAATYRFKVKGDSLWLRVNSRRWEKLRPLTRDEFTPHSRDPHDQRFLSFSRDSDGRVDGFSVGFWRIRGVQFSKVPESNVSRRP